MKSAAVRPGLKLSLTLISVLAVYFQSISHPFCLFDDLAIVEKYGFSSTLTFFDAVTPGSDLYYRPIVILSYWLDNLLWGMDSTFMHLENVVVHLINVFLVFLIASRLPASSENKLIPYLTALSFGLHPINSESVNWIAGRTDLYAGLFVLFAVYCLISAIQGQSKKFALIAFGVAFVGTLAKETAIMFIPAAFLVTMLWPVVPQDVSSYRKWRKRFLIFPIISSSALIFAILMYVYVKRHGNDAHSLFFEGSNNVALRIFEAFGFYVKKLFLPLPMNLAIIEISHLYAIAGIAILCILVATYRLAVIPWLFFLMSGLFTLPALVVAVKSFAWTPFGERYLYIPSAFAVIGCVECSYRFFVQRNKVKWLVPILIVIISLSSVATYLRGMLWGNNFALVEDIIAKSPSFGVARNEYAGLLNKEGRYAEAEKQLRIALQQKNKESTNRIIRLNLIWLEISGRSLDEAKRILLSKIVSKSTADAELLIQMNRIDESLLNKSLALTERRTIAAGIIESNDYLYLKTGEPHYLYRSGQVALSVGNRQLAGMYFKKAYNDPRLKEYYSESARRLAEKMEAK